MKFKWDVIDWKQELGPIQSFPVLVEGNSIIFSFRNYNSKKSIFGLTVMLENPPLEPFSIKISFDIILGSKVINKKLVEKTIKFYSCLTSDTIYPPNILLNNLNENNGTLSFLISISDIDYNIDNRSQQISQPFEFQSSMPEETSKPKEQCSNKIDFDDEDVKINSKTKIDEESENKISRNEFTSNVNKVKEENQIKPKSDFINNENAKKFTLYFESGISLNVQQRKVGFINETNSLNITIQQNVYNEISELISIPIKQFRVWELSTDLTILNYLPLKKPLKEIQTQNLFLQEKSSDEKLEVKPDNVIIFIKFYSHYLDYSPMLYIGSKIVNINDTLQTLNSFITKQLNISRHKLFIYLEKNYYAHMLFDFYSFKENDIKNGSIIIYQTFDQIKLSKEIISKYHKRHENKETISSYIDYMETSDPFDINRYLFSLANIIRVELIDYNDLSKSFGKIEFYKDISLNELIKFIIFTFDINILKNEKIYLFNKNEENNYPQLKPLQKIPQNLEKTKTLFILKSFISNINNYNTINIDFSNDSVNFTKHFCFFCNENDKIKDIVKYIPGYPNKMEFFLQSGNVIYQELNENDFLNKHLNKIIRINIVKVDFEYFAPIQVLHLDKMKNVFGFPFVFYAFENEKIFETKKRIQKLLHYSNEEMQSIELLIKKGRKYIKHMTIIKFHKLYRVRISFQ